MREKHCQLEEFINNKKNLSFRQRGEKKSHGFDTTAKQAMWRWRRVATASQSGGKRESEVRVTSGCRRCAENVCCLSSLVSSPQQLVALLISSSLYRSVACESQTDGVLSFISSFCR